MEKAETAVGLSMKSWFAGVGLASTSDFILGLLFVCLFLIIIAIHEHNN